MTRHLRLVCGSANPDKVVEIAAVLNDAGREYGITIELLPRPDALGDVVEDADTLEGNARLKAMAVATASGLPAIADDTGLEVAALGGEPGVYSARYAGPDATYADNRLKLLAELTASGSTDRSAEFATVAMVCWPDGASVVARGVCQGHIAEAERGARGFGYDPLFVPDSDPTGRTFAEMSDADKNSVSHRGRAFRNLVKMFADFPEPFTGHWSAVSPPSD
ncbi:MAG: RdgB/HAM1 family non-canonical purine NTP pyrophosphatase [Actinobacteria bacterium]|uniref:dITP/XTP pyrophosphatase n=1 Tax=freshwater metagenome TaxID=449393 RepID=A0A6J6XQW2_9ZZZZ|nr:RdgB/HAM1 family non-canonical purine NTP pyrophosphatase [Actinomycetota bacterium]MSX79300.1 RdgB/HAM1 family non-canonical purine NTP pyrophosphatase [Actinomycetota bacterium]MSY13576.1 RdgB/HAM1 family non-canonical purine NTP pyrophosphatase [Actinomycetota bacterium]